MKHLSVLRSACLIPFLFSKQFQILALKSNLPIISSYQVRRMSHHPKSNQKRVLVPIADGSEEIEATTIIDTLIRAGAHVTVASVSNDLQVRCSRGVNIVADAFIHDVSGESFDLIACPGGMPGATHLRDSSTLIQMLRHQRSLHKPIGAICASPAVVLAYHGLLEGRIATCYPVEQFQSRLPTFSSETVVVDPKGDTITSQGPASSLPFALKLVEVLYGKEKSDSVASEMLFMGE